MSLDFENIATLAMRDYLAGGALETQLAAIEQEVGFGYTIPRPAADAYVAAFVPGDNRSPLLQIYAEGSDAIGDAAGHRHDLATTRVMVVITYVGGGNQLPAEERLLWQYVQAIRRAVRADYRIGTGGLTVKYAAWEASGRDFPLDDESRTHHARAVSFEIGVEDP